MGAVAFGCGGADADELGEYCGRDAVQQVPERARAGGDCGDAGVASTRTERSSESRSMLGRPMMPKTVQVKDFKSVTDSGVIRIDDDITCLVGKNESGKTAVLEALYRLNPASTGHRGTFDERHDFPRQRRTRERKTLGTLTPITVVFELEDADVADIEDRLGTGVVATREVSVSRNYDNDYSVAVVIDEAAAVRHVIEKAGLDPSIGSTTRTMAALRTALAGIAEPSEGQQKLAVDIVELDVNALARAIVVRRIPKFLYFDEWSELPGRVSIPYLQTADEATLDPQERTALSLLRLAGVVAEDFDESNYEDRRAAIEGARATLTSELFEYWRQNTELRVELDLDYKTQAMEAAKQPPYLDIRVENTRYGVTLNFGERSRGFQWFFSFLAAFSEYRDADAAVVLLLDEPGLGLHAAAQGDFLRYIEEDLARSHRVIYSTHSPFMVQAAKIDRVRLVEDRPKVGTRVSNEALGVSRDTAFPIQAALGYSLSQSLFLAPDNLVVEGPSDLLYLTAVSDHLRQDKRTHLNPRWVIVPAGGIEKVPTFVSLLGSQLNVAVVVDGASGPTQRLQTMVEREIISADHVLTLNDFTGTNAADIEDLLGEGFYVELLRTSGAIPKRKALPPGDRLVERAARLLEVSRFDHYAPAAYFIRHQADWLPRLDSEALDRFELLFERINELLS